MVYAEQQRESVVSVFDLTAHVALRVARHFAEIARKAKRARAAQAAKRPQSDARVVLRAQAPPRVAVARLREDVEALRMQRLL